MHQLRSFRSVQWQGAYIVGSFGNVGESWGDNGRLGDIKRDRHADACQGQVVVLICKLLPMVCPGLFDEDECCRRASRCKNNAVYPIENLLTNDRSQLNGRSLSRPHLSLQ